MNQSLNRLFKASLLTAMCLLAILTGDMIISFIQQTDYWPLWPMVNILEQNQNSAYLYVLIIFFFMYFFLWLTDSSEDAEQSSKQEFFKQVHEKVEAKKRLTNS